MAQNQATGGNSMAAMLGNMQNKTQRPGQPPSANYGAGMQAPMQGVGQVWRGPPPGQQGMQPIPPGGPGYPQWSPDQMQNLMGQISAMQKQPGGIGGLQRPMPQQPIQGRGPASLGNWGQALQSGAPGNMLPQNPNLPRRPMPPMGAPGMGAGGGKNQQIAQLPGAPTMMGR